MITMLGATAWSAWLLNVSTDGSMCNALHEHSIQTGTKLFMYTAVRCGLKQYPY